MLLLSRCKLPKLFLRNASIESLNRSIKLSNILLIQTLTLGTANQLFNLEQTGLVEVYAQPIVDLGQHSLQEPCRVLLLSGWGGDDFVHKAGRREFLDGNALAHDQGLVGLGDAQALDKSARRAAFGHQAQ